MPLRILSIDHTSGTLWVRAETSEGMLSYWFSDIRQNHDWTAPNQRPSDACSPFKTGGRATGDSSPFALTQPFSYLTSIVYNSTQGLLQSRINAVSFPKCHHFSNTSLNSTVNCCDQQGWSHLSKAMISSRRICDFQNLSSTLEPNPKIQHLIIS